MYPISVLLFNSLIYSDFQSFVCVLLWFCISFWKLRVFPLVQYSEILYICILVWVFLYLLKIDSRTQVLGLFYLEIHVFLFWKFFIGLFLLWWCPLYFILVSLIFKFWTSWANSYFFFFPISHLFVPSFNFLWDVLILSLNPSYFSCLPS